MKKAICAVRFSWFVGRNIHFGTHGTALLSLLPAAWVRAGTGMPKADANAGNDEGLYGRAIKNNALRVKDSLVETVSQLVVHPQGACEPEKGEKKNSTWRFVGNTAERVKDGAVGISSSALAAVMSVASTAATRLTGDDAVTVAPKKKEKTRFAFFFPKLDAVEIYFNWLKAI